MIVQKKIISIGINIFSERRIKPASALVDAYNHILLIVKKSSNRTTLIRKKIKGNPDTTSLAAATNPMIQDEIEIKKHNS